MSASQFYNSGEQGEYHSEASKEQVSGGEGDRGIISTVIGGAAGAYGGSKISENHSTLGGIAGAFLGAAGANKVEDEWEDHENNKNQEQSYVEGDDYGRRNNDDNEGNYNSRNNDDNEGSYNRGNDDNTEGNFNRGNNDNYGDSYGGEGRRERRDQEDSGNNYSSARGDDGDNYGGERRHHNRQEEGGDYSRDEGEQNSRW